MTISKVIHYIWLGNNELPPLYKACIESWKTHHPDWQIKLWNESNIPFEIPYVEKALKDKQYAFASDCLRVYLLKNYGGVYLDVDMEIVKPLDNLIESGSFLGFERENRINCAIMGFSKDHPLLDSMCIYYTRNVGHYKAIPRIASEIIASNNIDDLNVYNQEYFYPYNPFVEGTPRQLMYKDITPNTYAIHHWGHSWTISNFQKVKNICLKFFRSLTH